MSTTSSSLPYGTPVGFDGRRSVAGTETDYYINSKSHQCEDERTSDDPITSYGWDFGDGTTASGSTANHTYTRAGDFTATLTVRTAHKSDSTSTVISVKGVVPSLAVSQTTEWRKSFDASGSQGAYALADYAWEFGDGDVEHGATATHTYAAAGQYTVKLTVTDVNGMSASATEALDIAADHTAPGIAVRTPGPDAVYLVGQPVTADYSCSDDGGSGFPRGADGGLLAKGCLGALAPGETIDTTTPGDRSFTVATEDVAGNKGTAAVSYHVVSKAPTVSITSPADGASYARGAIVASNYTCVILWVSATCTGSAPDGSDVANGEPFDTSTLGHHTFTAVGRTAQGTATTKTVGYEVVDATAPTAVVHVPAESSVVRRGEIVRASFTCRDEAGGSGIASCSGERPSGAPVDTATPGSKTFTVRSKDRAGNEGSTTIHYYVSNYPTLPSSVSMKYVYGSSAASIKIKRLLVSRAPKGARIAVRCHGEGCPKSKHRPLVMAHDGQVVLRRWKGTELQPGETFKVSITKPLSTGVRFDYRVGRGHKVAKRVLCLPPGEKARKC